MSAVTQPLTVLFVCNLNRVRSPMAAALAHRLGGAVVVADSCGLVAADEIDPFVAAVMAEIGIDLTEHQPKGFDGVRAEAFDLIISLTPEAARRVATLAGLDSTAIEVWPVADPTLEDGSREQRLEAYRAVRDDLRRRLAARFGPAG